MMNNISSLFSYFSAAFSLFIFLSVLAGLLYLFLRGAYFIFFNKLWSFFHRDKFYDAYLDAEREKSLDVERFKIMFGLHRVDDIQTVKDTHRAVKWAHSSAIALRTLGKAGVWVNWKEQRVEKPKAVQRAVLPIFWILITFLIAIFATLVIRPDAIIKFKESEVWAWQGEKGLHSFLASGDKKWVYDLSDCSLPKQAQTVPFLEDEREWVCAAVKSGDYFSSLHSTVKFQRYFSAPILIFLMWCSVLLLLKSHSLSTALRLHRILHPCRNAQ
ncbi:DUF6216 family protein [Alcaligenes sp. CHO6]|uniref:DUF6216 family protein n=1 Tax=unclassified Alcaligenes TaxID=259357 RepID=UPI0030144292